MSRQMHAAPVKDQVRCRQRARWAMVAAVATCMVVIPSVAFAVSWKREPVQSGGRRLRKLQLTAEEPHEDISCEMIEQKNGTVDCLELWKPEKGNKLSRCGKCQEPQGPELDFSWDSEFQRRFRDVPIAPQMTCHGIRDFTRTCYFKDILWDLEKEKWVVFGHYSEVLGGMGEIPKEGEPWLRLDRATLGDERQNHMHVDWRATSDTPPPEAVVTSPLEAVHVRTMLNPASIGHFMRDNLLALVTVPMAFGLDPRKFVWLQTDSDLLFAEAYRAGSPLLQHYRSWMPADEASPAPYMLLKSLLRQGKQAAQARGAAQPDALVRFIRFPQLLAGRGGADYSGVVGELTDDFNYQTVLTWSHVCKASDWRSMRSIAYANNMITHKPARQHKPLILFIDGRKQERRIFPGVTHLLPELRNKFPDAEVRYELISELSGEEQLELLSRTTVLVSTIGSRSFRMALLPDGAQTILVGPPEKFGADEDHLQPFNMPFREVEWCWGSLGYVNVLLYSLSEPGDLEDGTFALGDDIIFVRDNYKARLRSEKLVPLLQLALKNVKAFGDSLWQQGSL